MYFEQLHTDRGCCSYVLGCTESCVAVVIDPDILLVDKYRAIAATHGLRYRYAIDTHTHADHFSAVQALRAHDPDLIRVMHANAAAPGIDMRVDDGELLVVGSLRLQVIATPGHTIDSISVFVGDRVLTGDALLIGACGRTDFPGGDAGTLYDSIFGKLLKLDDAVLVFPGHDYKRRNSSTIGEQKASNPRLQVGNRQEFIELMGALNLGMPEHLTEALRTNQTGGKTVSQLLAEAAARVPFMSIEELARRLDGAAEADEELLVLDVRTAQAYAAGHLPGAVHVPRGQLELRIDKVLPNPRQRVVVYCQVGKISTLATATLRDMGFTRAVGLDGGMTSWREAGHTVERS